MGDFPIRNRLAGGTGPQDPVRKAQVDTVRLKKDLDKDMDNSARHHNMANDLAFEDRPNKMAAYQLQSMKEEDSARARGDTLKLARKGKIPAKP